jgi:hypothetical protein
MSRLSLLSDPTSIMLYGKKRCQQPVATRNRAMADSQKQPARPTAAERALKEAEERRAAHERSVETDQREIGGREGPDPTRHGDWEKGGIASDF